MLYSGQMYVESKHGVVGARRKKRKWYFLLFVGLVFVLASYVVAHAKPAPAEFEVVSLDITPSEVVPGEQVSIAVEVANIGGTVGNYGVGLAMDGAEQIEFVEMAPGETGTVSFTVASDEPGDHSVDVGGLTGSYRVLNPGGFTTSGLVITPPIADVGQMVAITAHVSNLGEIEGSCLAALTIEGSQVETKELTLAPAAMETASFTFAPDTTGTYRIEVGEVCEVLTVVETGGNLGGALAELNAAFPELYAELLRLPDLEEIDDKDIEAIGDIVYLALDPEHRSAFESILDEGIEDKRKYCAPLEALLWVAYDREFDGYNPLSNYSLTELINDAWKNTTTSEEYVSERWADFDEVVDRLNSPDLISIYMVDNISYDYEKLRALVETGTDIWQTPQQTFNRHKAICKDRARFALYNLLQNGYGYNDFEVREGDSACILFARPRKWKPGRGHVVCLYVDNTIFYTIDNCGIKGPFSTVDAAADATYHGWSEYSFLDINHETTETVSR